MLYRFLQVYVRFILKFFIKDVKITGMEKIPNDRAVMFAAFHPNSFLDAIILDTTVKRPIWSLARGDAFKRDWVRNILEKLCMMPIYRISEGKENLGKNDETFQKCSEVFSEKGQVLIFSEGLCKNQSELLPLKKGTARLALLSWSSNIDVMVIPTAINYSQFTSIGKKITINFEDPICSSEFENLEPSGTNVLRFNKRLQEGLEKAVSRDFKFNTLRQVLYYIGLVLNFPLYFLVKSIVKPKTRGTVFFDSIYLAILVFALPIYWIILFSISCVVFNL